MATVPATEPFNTPGAHCDTLLLAEVLLDLAERAQAYSNAAGVAIALVRGKDLLVRTSTGTAPEVGTIIPLSDGFIGECVRTLKPLIGRDIESDSRVGPVLRALKTRSLMAIPVCEVRDIKGVMVVVSPLPNTFQPTHSAILMTVSDIIAAKLREHEAVPEVNLAIFDEPEPVPVAETAPQMAWPEIVPAAPEMIEFAAPEAEQPAIAPFEPEFPATAPVVTAPPAPVINPPVVAAPAPVVMNMPVVATPVPPVAKPAAVVPPAPPAFNPPVVAPPVPAVMNPPVVTPPAPPVFKPPVVTPAAPAVMHPLVVAPPVSVAIRPPVVTPPPPAVTKPPVVAPPAAAVAMPPLGSPTLPTRPALAMMEEKIELAERDPALLTPSEDPLRFRPQRAFTATTISSAPSSTSATVAPRSTPITTLRMPEAGAPLAASVSAPSISFLTTPATTGWEMPEETREKRPWFAFVASFAAVLIIGAAVWMHVSASKEVPAPATPLPSAAAATAALPNIAPLPTAVVTTTTTATKPLPDASAKAAKAPENQPAQPEMKHVSARVIEIAAAQPKPAGEPEPDMLAPKLPVATNDPGIRSLSKVTVPMPAAPRSDLVPASLVSRVAPIYPQMARQLAITGIVVLKITIAKDGSISAVHATDGAIQLRQAAIDAVRRWRYKPAMLNGNPVETEAEVRVNFTK